MIVIVVIIEGLINKSIIQLNLFEENLVEMIHDNVRYLLRRNPQRALEIGENRIYHQKANRTKACVFVAMLAYAIKFFFGGARVEMSGYGHGFGGFWTIFSRLQRIAEEIL